MSIADRGGAPALITDSPTVGNAIDAPLDRSQRLAGLFIVLTVSVLPLVLSSLLTLVGGEPTPSQSVVRYRYFNGIVMELTSLGLLAYVLRQNGQKFADFGLVLRSSDVVFGTLLWVAALCAYRLAFPTILSACELLGWQRTAPYIPSFGIGALAYAYVVVSPVFEEMIVRAFLITETTALTGSSAAAILLSVLLQTSYHLYQGIPYALSSAVIFLMFSIYYARTRRIVAVIVAHLIWDTYALLSYALRIRIGHA